MKNIFLRPTFSLWITSFVLYLIEYYLCHRYKYLEPSGLFVADIFLIFCLIVWSRNVGLISLFFYLIFHSLKIISGIYFIDPFTLLSSIKQLNFSLLKANIFLILTVALAIASLLWIGFITVSKSPFRDFMWIIGSLSVILFTDSMNGSSLLSPQGVGGFPLKHRVNILYSLSYPWIQQVVMNKNEGISTQKVESALGHYLEIAQIERQKKADHNIVFIVVESLGALDAHNNFGYTEFTKEHPSLFLIKRGLIPFHGSTTWAGIRERYGLVGTYPIPNNLLSQSYIWRLRSKGYHTIGIHSYRGTMFNRSYWWPKEGFQDSIFMENRINEYPLHFGVFTALNDEEMLAGEIRRARSKSPYFVYFLSVNTHFPTQQDPKVFLENGLLKMIKKIDLLVQDGTLTKSNVIIVGDHAPPIDNTLYSFMPNVVPYWIFQTTR